MFSVFRAASALARRLLWRRSVVVTDSTDAAGDFGRAAKEDDVCIVEEIVVDFRRSEMPKFDRRGCANLAPLASSGIYAITFDQINDSVGADI